MSSIDMVDDDEARSDELRGYRDAREDDKSVSDEVNQKRVCFYYLKRLRELVKGKRSRFAKLTKASVMCQKLCVENY